MSTHLSAVALRSFENDQNSDLEQARNEFASALAQWEKDGGEKAAEIRQRSSKARDAVQDACTREEEVSKPAWYRNSNQMLGLSHEGLIAYCVRIVPELSDTIGHQRTQRNRAEASKSLRLLPTVSDSAPKSLPV